MADLEVIDHGTGQQPMVNVHDELYVGPLNMGHVRARERARAAAMRQARDENDDSVGKARRIREITMRLDENKKVDKKKKQQTNSLNFDVNCFQLSQVHLDTREMARSIRKNYIYLSP